GDMRLNESRALSELPGPLKRLHFSAGNDDGPASGAQRKADSLADTAAASGDYRGPHVVCHKMPFIGSLTIMQSETRGRVRSRSRRTAIPGFRLKHDQVPTLRKHFCSHEDELVPFGKRTKEPCTHFDRNNRSSGRHIGKRTINLVEHRAQKSAL